MKSHRALLLAICALLALVAFMTFCGDFLGANRSVPKIIWRQQKTSARFLSILPSTGCIGILGSENKRDYMYCLDDAGRVLATKLLGSQDSFFESAGASRDSWLFCLVTRKDKRFVPLVIDMRKGEVYSPILAGVHATPMPYVGPPSTSALCPCGKSMLVHGHDTRNGKVRYRSWIVESLSGKLVREVMDRPSGRDSFYYYTWNDDCTLTWLDRRTGIIRNEKKGVLSDACKDVILNLPAGMCIKLSPDAAAIALYNPAVSGMMDVTVYSTTSGEKEWECQRRLQRSEKIAGVYWSPDSSKLCVGLDSSDDPLGLANESYVIGQDATIKKLSLSGWRFFGLYGHIAWLYDSKHVVCLLNDSRNTERQALVLFDVDKP